jgi:hypothetical protein
MGDEGVVGVLVAALRLREGAGIPSLGQNGLQGLRNFDLEWHWIRRFPPGMTLDVGPPSDERNRQGRNPSKTI